MIKNKKVKIKRNKKAEGLSMQTIVVAIIVVIVLIMVIAIFVMNMNKSNKDLNNQCIKKGGICRQECGNGLKEIKNVDGCPKKYHCCTLKVSVTTTTG